MGLGVKFNSGYIFHTVGHLQYVGSHVLLQCITISVITVVITAELKQVATFSGSEYISYNFRDDAADIKMDYTSEEIKFEFKTESGDALIFYTGRLDIGRLSYIIIGNSVMPVL